MLFDIYMIFLTSFAIFGIYCAIDMLKVVFYHNKMPKSITILKYNDEKYTKIKVDLLQDTINNNDILLIGSDEMNIYPDTKLMSKDDLLLYIKNEMFTKTVM